MRQLNRYLFLTLWLSCNYSIAGSIILVPNDVLIDYRQFVGDRDIQQIDYYGGAGARRDVVELILLQQALQHGGYDKPFQIRATPNYERAFYTLAAGKATFAGTTVWKQDARQFEPHVGISRAMVKEGDFTVGVYVCRADLAVPTSFDELLKRRIISSRQWTVDWRTLKSLGFKDLESVNSWRSMVKMLCHGRADITIAPFPSNSDLAIQVDEHRLHPVPNVRVSLNGSRHFSVSYTAPGSAAAKKALDNGLKEMGEEGVIKRAYQESGFLNDSTSLWPIMR